MSPALELRIHLTSGRTHRFVQEDPGEAEKIIRGINTGQIFRGPQLTLAGVFAMSFFRTPLVNQIDFITDIEHGWPRRVGLNRVAVISEQEFMETTGLASLGELQPRVKAAEAGEQTTMHFRVEFVGGQTTFLVAHMELQTRLERVRGVNQVLSNPSLWADLPGKGFTLINVSNVAVLNAVPGTPEAPGDAWMTRFLGMA